MFTYLDDINFTHCFPYRRDWLATYLSKYQGSILLVSHDIALLTKSVNSIAEVSGNTLIQYVSCSYEKYLTEKEFRAKSALAEYERNMEEYKRLQEFVDVWGASATKAKAAQSRVKMIEKMRKEGKLDPPPLGVTEKRWKPSLVLPDPPKGIGEKLLVLEGADIGYDPGAPILQGIDLVVNRGVKLILRGNAQHYFIRLILLFLPQPTILSWYFGTHNRTQWRW